MLAQNQQICLNAMKQFTFKNIDTLKCLQSSSSACSSNPETQIEFSTNIFLQCIANIFPTLNGVVNVAYFPLPCMPTCICALGPQLELHKMSTCGISHTYSNNNNYNEGNFQPVTVLGNGKSETGQKRHQDHHHRHNFTAIHCLHRPIP